MATPLVIVESPAKAKTISKFLGAQYDVRASVGHVADLPSKGLAVDVDNGFKPTYELTARGRDVVKDLRVALKDASELYLATDEDREGEAISWHLLEYAQAEGAREADGVPRDHQDGHRPRRQQPARHRLRAGRCGRDAAHPRPSVRLRGVAGALAPGEPRPVGRPRAEPARSASSSSASASGWRSSPPATGTSSCSRRPRRRSPPTSSRVDGAKVATGKDFGIRRAGQERRRSCSTRLAPARLAGALDGVEFTVRSVEERPYRSSPRSAVHDLHAAAGGWPQAAPVVAAR